MRPDAFECCFRRNPLACRPGASKQGFNLPQFLAQL
jgi:hypothetical protein